MKLCKFFYKELSIAYNKTFPYVRLSRKIARDKPWITTALKVSIKEKHKLYPSLFSARHLLMPNFIKHLRID